MRFPHLKQGILLAFTIKSAKETKSVSKYIKGLSSNAIALAPTKLLPCAKFQTVSA